MNMKKSIAAVSAGAMAISAMATVASANVIYHPTNENAAAAREQIVLTYDLSEYVEAFKPTSVKITTTYEGAEYLVKGLDIDKVNGNPDWLKDGGSEYGYSVILGDILKDIQSKNKQYFLQTVEFSAWSMDHHNPSIWDDGINGIRNRSKIWYSRASLGRDISDMQNEAAAVEDHDHIRVLVADGEKNLSEYAFQVRFEELAHSDSGDFILNDFKASDLVNAAHGTTVNKGVNSYILGDALTVKDTIFKNSPVAKLQVTSNEGNKVDYIDSKLEAMDYEIVAVADKTTDATQGTVYFTISGLTFNNAFQAANGKQADADAEVHNALKDYFRKANGKDLTAADFDGVTVATWYWDGVKFVDDPSLAAAIKIEDKTNLTYVGKVGADANHDGVLTKAEDTAAPTVYAPAANDGKPKTDNDFIVAATTANTGVIDAAFKNFAAAAATSANWTTAPTYQNQVNVRKEIFEGGDVAHVLSYKYYVVKKASVKATDLDTRFDVNGASGDFDELNNKIYVYNADAVKGYDHWAGNKSTNGWIYSFNKFVVTSTFTVDYDDWDKADFYTGQGANAKFVPLHNGIGRDAKTIDRRPTADVYNEEAFYGTSSVNFNFPGAYQIIKPMRSTLTAPADVIKALEARKDGGKHYTSPVTVLNDVVGNNEEISFEFVSCSKYVRNTKYVEAIRGRKVKNYDGSDCLTKDGVTLWTVTMVNPTTGENETRMFRGDKFNKSISGDYFGEDKGVRVLYDEAVDSKFKDKFFGSVDTKNGGHLDEDWYNPVFGQHLYTNATYGTDNNHSLSTNGTGYALTGPNADGGDQTGNAAYNNAWGANAIGNYGSYNYGGWNTNLFNGGLVINSNWTMQINDSKHFDWGNNSIIFFWSDLTAEVKTHATNFLVAMQLYTPADWYWDTLNVGVGAAAAENVFNGASGEGLENDGEEVVEDDEVEELPEDEEEYFEDFEEEEEPEEEYYEEDDFDDFDDFEEEEEEEPEEVEVEVKEVPSPKTGNSPIALAVIPVALAAAAIVAKKKND